MATEVIWNGMGYSFSGFAKLSREFLFRIAKHMKVKYDRSDVDMNENVLVSDETRHELDLLLNVEVNEKSPFIRAHTPVEEFYDTYRVCYTMQETTRLHPGFVDRLNRNYEEVWVPTQWSKTMFSESGVKVPVFQMPLGVDERFYFPSEGVGCPPSMLLTTPRAGIIEPPRGFLFVYVFQPTPRKGLDLLFKAFETAFENDPDAALVLGTTVYDGLHYSIDVGLQKFIKKTRVYGVQGRFTEMSLARLYNGCHAYVCTSHGEGWNLPMTEAAACGKPVIMPRNTAHLEFASKDVAFVFDSAGTERQPPSNYVCKWYRGMQFSSFDDKSFWQLVEHLKSVKDNYSEALKKADRFKKLILDQYTWDKSTERIVDRIKCL